MKLLYIQYAGDFAEAYDRLIKNNGKENYYGQSYSVNTVVQQARNNIKVMVLVLNTQGYRANLEKNLISVVLNKTEFDYKVVQSEILDFSPDATILRCPDYKILRILRKNRINTFPVFADSFEKIPVWKIRRQFRKIMLARELKNKSIKWVSNHQLNASRSLQNIGVNANKILPYDWEHSDNPSNWKKNIPNNLPNKTLVIFYAGSISISKGIFDLVTAAKDMRNSGKEFIIKIAGKGEIDKLLRLSKELGVFDQIEVLGLINHDDVLSNMNKADVVIVPSHHAYPEGLPMTIMESLMVHTPVIASDHPMFVGRVGLRGSVVFFREKDAKDLCDKVLSTCNDLDHYKKMSSNAKLEWMDLNLKLKWAEMINKWISNPAADFSQHTLEHF